MARPNLAQHRKFRRLARSLRSAIVARGALEILWDFCYESGEDYIGTAEDLETLVGWTGKVGQLATALLEAGAPEGYGFIEPVEDANGGAPRFRVHDLWHHAPDYVNKRRKRELERRQKSEPVVEDRRAEQAVEDRRAEERRSIEVSVQAERRTEPVGRRRPPSPDSQTEVVGTPALALAPAPALAPARAQKESSSATSAEPASPAVLRFPVVGTDGPEWALTQTQVETWGRLYPNLDIEAECRKALAWVQANPGHRKTGRGMPPFLVRWLNRAVNDRSGPAPRSRTTPDRFTATELSDAKRIRANWFGRCQHEPTCDNAQQCVGVIIRDMRTRMEAQ